MRIDRLLDANLALAASSRASAMKRKRGPRLADQKLKLRLGWVLDLNTII